MTYTYYSLGTWNSKQCTLRRYAFGSGVTKTQHQTYLGLSPLIMTSISTQQLVTLQTVDGITVDASNLFTCLSCSIAFQTAEDQRAHYRSDHHRYNMKVWGSLQVKRETHSLRCFRDVWLVCRQSMWRSLIRRSWSDAQRLLLCCLPKTLHAIYAGM